MRNAFCLICIGCVLWLFSGCGASASAQQASTPAASVPTAPASVASAAALPAYAPALPAQGELARSVAWMPAAPSPVHDPAYMALEQKVRSLTEVFRQVKSDGEREKLRQQLVELTTQQFEWRQQRRLAELDRLRQQMQDVESKVQRREELKQQIIERRVAQLTSEDAELQWDVPSPAPIGRPVDMPGPAMLPNPTYGTPQPQVPRDHPASENDPFGPYSYYPPHVPGAYYPPHVPGAPSLPGAPDDPFGPNVPAAEATPTAPVAPPAPEARGAEPEYRPINPAEARIRLESAARILDRASQLFERDAISAGELQKAQDELSLAQAAFDAARREWEGRRKLLELDVRQMRLEVEAAKQKLATLREIAERSGAAVSQFEVQEKQTAVEKAEIALQRADTLLDMHLASNPDAPPPGPEGEKSQEPK